MIPGLGRSPGGGNGKPTQVFLPGGFHGQRRLAGYSPWGDFSQGLHEGERMGRMIGDEGGEKEEPGD